MYCQNEVSIGGWRSARIFFHSSTRKSVAMKPKIGSGMRLYISLICHRYLTYQLTPFPPLNIKTTLTIHDDHTLYFRKYTNAST